VSNALCNRGDHAVTDGDKQTLKDVISKLGLHLKESIMCYKTIVGVDCGHGDDFW